MQLMRQDLLMREEAEAMGFTVDDSRGRSFPLRFQMGRMHVWYCSKGWAVAKLDETDRFTCHEYLTDLRAALRRAKDRHNG